MPKHGFVVKGQKEEKACSTGKKEKEMQGEGKGAPEKEPFNGKTNVRGTFCAAEKRPNKSDDDDPLSLPLPPSYKQATLR